VALELPSELTWTMRAFGFQWPDLNEDHFKEAASHLRQYARDASTSIDATHRRVRDLREVYESGSYEALVSTWGSQTRGHLQILVQGCHYVADALDIAAAGIVAMKGAVIAQLGIAAAEFAADQAAAVATFGVAEAAEKRLGRQLLDKEKKALLLTNAEKAAIRDNAWSIMKEDDFHIDEGRTSGGRNTAKQIALDAEDLAVAVEKDFINDLSKREKSGELTKRRWANYVRHYRNLVNDGVIECSDRIDQVLLDFLKKAT